ncbi:predicted protein [Sclerotinia sclerotiorum 1980 UF-70]|uniref:Uncharacterized protein n=2 Tax=Sclerotinia sclerotiorum (strain ATCC 18683 / 1980 / Ss-1) TaxID=665079 RepID=A7EVF9_SCLS1|nr:predicted protein [Sclerotinia sclerotiorum 1980 UF-70]APA15818.1 hypothetical protein sscle_15g105880 [Sclerotinia sclerotiorum 1980 UF-70]EDN93451.1 predicted protein [Sclerotinia sclerotiorum 1980 UF-70]
MPSSSRRGTVRAHNSYGTSNSIREYNSRTNLVNHSHIQTRPAESIPGHPGSKDELESPDFIIKESAQEEIQDQLEYETRLQSLRNNHSRSPPSISHPPHSTYAEVMAARSSRSRRRNEALDEGPDMRLGGPMTLESLGPFKYTFKKKKNSKSKYSASMLNEEAIEAIESTNNSNNGGEDIGIMTNEEANMDMGHSESTSEVGTDPELVGGGNGGGNSGGLSSRPISPTSTPQFKSSLDFPSPHTTLQKQQNLSEFTSTAPAPKRVIQILQKDTENLKDFNISRENKLEDDSDKENINRNISQPIVITDKDIATTLPLPLSLSSATTNTPLTDSISPPLVIPPPPGLSRVSSISYSTSDNTRAQTLYTIDSGIDLNHSSLDFLKCDDSDTQSLKDKSEAVMARIAESTGLMTRTMSDLTTANDGFDSVEWDPDLPVRSINDSPEPLLVEAQPVAYTTVGSRVNPNLQPQISAPNRIQREGSIRRPQLDPTHNRQANYYTHTRGPPPPLNMQNSMHYAQQLGQASNTFNTPPATSARSARSLRVSQRLSQTEQENHTLLRLQGMINARVPGGHYPASPNTPTPASHQNHISSISNDDQDMGRGNDLQGPISGLEKMQTLQRLARFPNPMQTSALRRLSELQAPKTENTANLNEDVEVSSQALENLLRNSKDKTVLGDVHATKNGELDRSYTFPPPGISNAAYNPLYGAYAGANGHSRDSGHHRGVPGYPQPLTAGPPGQRSYTNNRQNSNYSEEAWTQDQVVVKQNSHTNTGAISPWQEPKVTNEQYTAQAPAPAPSARATDTISMQEASRYYPHGFPADMTGRFTRLSIDVQKEMGLLVDEETPEQARTRKQKEKDEWFYAGQKRWNMTIQDHITEIETYANPFGPIGPPTKKTLVSDNRPLPGITISEMQKKTIPEVIAPMIDGALGNLFAIKAQQEEGNSTLPFMRYTKSPDWHIDTSPRGNDSFFGEDWGVAINVPNTHNARIQRY